MKKRETMLKPVIAKITEKYEVTPWAHLLWLEAPTIAAPAKPGQFVMVDCGEETFLHRPFSIHRVDGDKLALLFNVVGKGTAWLAERKPGDQVDIFGPLGNGFTLPPKKAKILLVAGGIGIAPLRFLADVAKKQGCSIKLLVGGQTASQIYPCDFLSNGDVIYTTEDATLGIPGRVTVVVPDYFDWADQVFACGP
ncbi:dihydroorotate dehydrogenase electron transfer subunit, partial [Chloroflexota bacterium]